jgi:predicted permease
MRIPLVAGRDFDAGDRLGTLPVAIVSRELERRSWPAGSALGRQVREAGDPVWRTIVGVVGDSRQRTLGEDLQPRLYVPVLQAPINFSNVVARTSGDPLALASAVRAAIWSVDPEQPIWSVTSMEQLLARSTWQVRFTTRLVGGFAVLALLLAAVGVYGVMSYAVVRRTREVGIRIAVGASPAQAVALVLRRGVWMTAAATGLGLVGAAGATRLIRSQLFGVGPGDPATFVVAPAVLAGAALLACWIPARRAARVDPIEALRSE